MSTKCTILYGKKNAGYHLYFDYADDDYHLEFDNKDGMHAFVRRAGKLLEGCPFADSGLYIISMKKGVKSKVIKDKDCYWIKKKLNPNREK